MKRLNWIIVVCGLWEAGDVVAPFVPGFGTVPIFIWNHVVVGFVLVIVGAWAAVARNLGTTRVLDWVAAVAGVWLVVASFIFGNPVVAVGLWNDVVVGAVVAVLGVWAALSVPREAG